MISRVKVYAIEQLNNRGSVVGYLLAEGGVCQWPPPRNLLAKLWVSTNRGVADRFSKTLTLDPKRPMRVVEIETIGPYDL